MMRSMFLGMVVLAVAASGCSSIVEVGCEQGYTPCHGVCVALDSDATHCGACDVVCATPVCNAGVCRNGELGDGSAMPLDASWMGGDTSPAPDAWAAGDTGDAGVAGDASDAATTDDTSVALDDAAVDVDAGFDDAFVDVDAAVDDDASVVLDDASMDVDGGPAVPVCDLGESLCDGSCVRLASDPTHCGDCDVVCPGGAVCSDGTCMDTCGDGLTLCDRRCVDTTTSATDCGGCGVACYTGVCETSVCIEGYSGHLVVIGHDYTASRGPMQQLLSNALGLTAVRSTPRVLHFTTWATPASILGVEAALTHARPIRSSYVTDPLDVTLALETSDVLLVYAMHDATDEVLGEMGLAWSRALATFLSHGGVVIALDSTSPTNDGGAARWIDAAGLATFVPHADASGALLTIAAPADALVVGLPLSYRAETWSAHWVGYSLPIVIDDRGAGVVFHRTVSP